MRMRSPFGSKNGVSTTDAVTLSESVTMVNVDPIFECSTGT